VIAEGASRGFRKNLAVIETLIEDPPQVTLNGKWKSQLLEKYHDSDKRLILLDYDGTLVPIVRQPKEAFPDRSLCNLLKSLTADERNEIYIISGRKY
jgi:trehalose 6-phosphate synthase/phosphatase